MLFCCYRYNSQIILILPHSGALQEVYMMKQLIYYWKDLLDWKLLGSKGSNTLRKHKRSTFILPMSERKWRDRFEAIYLVGRYLVHMSMYIKMSLLEDLIRKLWWEAAKNGTLCVKPTHFTFWLRFYNYDSSCKCVFVMHIPMWPSFKPNFNLCHCFYFRWEFSKGITQLWWKYPRYNVN